MCDTREEGVAVVKLGEDECMDQIFQVGLRQERFDFGDGFQLNETRLDSFLNALMKS